MRLPKTSIRAKIVATIILAALLVLGLGAWIAFDKLHEAGGEGRYLRRHWERYERLGLDVGASEYGIARVIAVDPTLVTALAGGDGPRVVDTMRRLLDPLHSALGVDLFVVSDASGTPWSVGRLASVDAAEWRESRLFQDLRDGKSVRSKVAVLGDRGYRVSGATIKNGETNVGVVLLGQQLDPWFADIAAQSSDDIPKQHRISLVIGDAVIASALPQKDWPALVRAARKPATAREGDEKIPVLEIDGLGTYDFWSAPAYGYGRRGDPETTQIGTFYLVRTRLHRTERITDAIWDVVTVFGIALVIAIVLGYLLAVQITRPLKRYISATEDLTRGQADLSRRLEVHTNDEFGILAANLNRMFAKIHTLAGAVQRSAFQVSASSGEISTVSKRLHDGAREQASKITNSTAAVTELSSSIQQVAENAAEATRTAKQSGEAVTRAIERLSHIRATVEDAAARIAALGESSKRIGRIVEVIRQISEQTTMLALNAAIEAAHAGEHGRGFAVVADEVSSLAKRTGQSARDIEDLIAAIRDQTGEAVRVMDNGTREVEDGTGLVEKTLADLKTLISVIDDTASAVQEQAIASDEIARNMDDIQRIAGVAVLASENAVAQGDRLQQLADGLASSVRGFKIDAERIALDEEELKALPPGPT
jgi:methyl-accepting chemotaxis protein